MHDLSESHCARTLAAFLYHQTLSGVRRCNTRDTGMSRIGPKGLKRISHKKAQKELQGKQLCFLASLNNEAEALQRAIELLQIERFAQVKIAAGFQRRFFHAVNVVGGDRDNRHLLAFVFELTEAFDRL